YRPNPEAEFHTRAGGGDGSPHSGKLFGTQQGLTGNNRQLQQQTNECVDLGMDWSPSGSFPVGVPGFYEFFSNELVTQSPGASLQNFTFNAPASEHRGVEVSTEWRPFAGWLARAA